MQLIPQLQSHHIIKQGHFTLKSGVSSSLYFNFKSLTCYPTLFADICYQLSKLIITDDDCIIAGVPLGGIPFATLMSYMLAKPMILIRKEKKDYGMKQQIENEQSLFSNIILIEDCITSGSSVLETIDILKQHCMTVKQIVCILDRQAGGVERLTQIGYQVNFLYQLKDFTTPLLIHPFKTNDTINKLLTIVNDKKTNIIASIDCHPFYDLINIVGPHVCAIKIHNDIYNQFNHLDYQILNNLKQQYNFLIIEDRKLSDITSICLKQLQWIKQYADIVTVHGLCGEMMVQEVSKQLPVIIVCNMSIKDNLIDRTYINKVLDIKCDHLVGYVSQYKIDNYLTFTPGIHIDSQHDQLDQIYHQPNQASDFYIIGRGLFEGDVLTNVLKYKQLCYNK